MRAEFRGGGWGKKTEQQPILTSSNVSKMHIHWISSLSIYTNRVITLVTKIYILYGIPDHWNNSTCTGYQSTDSKSAVSVHKPKLKQCGMYTVTWPLIDEGCKERHLSTNSF